MKRGFIPKRTCLICGCKILQKELIRYVYMQGSIIKDISRILPGRGVYCCTDIKCLERFNKKTKKLKKAFRLQGDE